MVSSGWCALELFIKVVYTDGNEKLAVFLVDYYNEDNLKEVQGLPRDLFPKLQNRISHTFVF